MRWRQAKRHEDRRQPDGGTYQKWKPQIAEDCHNRCVYCAISDSIMGIGIRFFTIDHFRPKSVFGNAETTISNLYYCCAVCNTYKSDDWQGDVTDAQKDVGYLDPSTYDYNSYFIVSRRGLVGSDFASVKYMIEKMNLNRGQLIFRRRIHRFYEWSRQANRMIEKLMANAGEEDLRSLLTVILTINKLKRRIDESRIEAKHYTRA